MEEKETKPVKEERALTTSVPNLLNLSVADAVVLASKYFLSRAFSKEAIENEDQAFLKIMAGQELGIAPVEAINQLYIVNGKVGMGCQLMGSLVKSHGYEYTWAYDNEDNPTSCVVTWYKAGKKLGTSRFTKADAVRARLIDTNKPASAWNKYPKELYFARAFTSGARKFAPEALSSIGYTKEELESTEPNVIEGEYKEIKGDDTPKDVKATPAKADSPTVASVEPSPPVEVPEVKEITLSPSITGDMQYHCWEHGEEWKDGKWGKSHPVHLPDGEVEKDGDGKTKWCNFSMALRPFTERISFMAGMSESAVFNEFLKKTCNGKTWSKIDDVEKLAILAMLENKYKSKVEN